MREYFLYGGRHSQELDKHLYELTNKKEPIITIIPSSSISEKDKNFRKVLESTFKKVGFLVDYFPIDRGDILGLDYKPDIIYLSGGKEISFLKNLVEKKVDKLIFQKNPNSIISGLCAGGIVLTDSIEIGKIYEEGLEGGDGKNDSLKGLRHLPFLFFPFYEEKYKEKIKEFSVEKSGKLIFGTPKECGLNFDGKIITIVGNGKVEIYKNGDIIKILSSGEKYSI